MLFPVLLLLSIVSGADVPCCVYYFSGQQSDAASYSPCTKTAPGGISWTSNHANEINGAISFSYGSSLRCPASMIPTGNAPRTVMLWLRCPPSQSSPQGWAYAVSWGTAGQTNSRAGIGVQVSTKTVYFVSENNDLNSGSVICDSQWHNVAYSWTGAALSVYNDGNLAASQSRGALATINTGLIDLSFNGGTSWKNGEFLAAAMSDVRVYDVALTSAQIISEAQRRLTLLQSIMPGYYFDISAGSVKTPCPTGYSCPGQTLDPPVLCPSGTYSNAGLECVACPCPDACTTSGLASAPSCSRTPSSTRSSTPSQTMTPTSTVSQTMTPSSTPSQTMTPSSTVTSTGTSTTSTTVTSTPSRTLTPTPSQTSSTTFTPTPSQTFTPSPTATTPPFSCLSRTPPRYVTDVGCSIPVLTVGTPTLASGGALPNAPTLVSTIVASWPWLRAPLSLELPSTPSPTETLTIVCSAASSALSIISASSNQPSCPATTMGSACVIVVAGTMQSPLSFFVLGSPPTSLNLSTSTTTTVTCTVSSNAIQSATAEHPRYGSSTLLTLPAIALPSSWPLIAGILKESRAVPGDFTAVAGFSKAAEWSISLGFPPLDASCDEMFYTNSTTVQWSSPHLPRCPPAVETIASLIASARSLGTAPSLSVAVFGVTHFLLVAGWGTRFPETTTVTLGGVSCNVNWVSSDGSILSVLTPSLSSLCPALGFSVNATDCGTAQLLLSGASWPTTASTIVSVAIDSLRDATLSLPISYGPAVAGADWRGTLAAASSDPTYARVGVINADSPFAVLASTVSGDSNSLTLSSALTPPGIGLRAMAECKDFSPAALCAASVAASYEPPTNLTCSWGSGDSCEICPLGAQCPGGKVLLARPGWWTPLSAASPPSDLKPCPQPDALIRCPGWRNVTSVGAASAMGCGSGYRGVACGACAVGYTLKSGICVLCPSLGRDKLLAAAAPVLIFISCLLFIGASLTLFVKWIGASWGNAVFAAAALSAWFFTAAQSAAAAFTVTQSISPPELEVYYLLHNPDKSPL